jgi:uncharacterized protein YqiB (DUF1249 family)
MVIDLAKNIYELIYEKLQKIGILDENGIMQASYMKFESPGLMDLSVDRLTNNTLSLAHNGVQNGDLMADPDVEVRINQEGRMAEGLTFQNDYLGIYHVVYPEPGKYRPKLKKDLNEFLNDWLTNMIEAGYVLVEKEDSG